MLYREHIKACKDTKSSNKKQSLPRFFFAAHAGVRAVYCTDTSKDNKKQSP